jgi:hypothetical protein
MALTQGWQSRQKPPMPCKLGGTPQGLASLVSRPMRIVLYAFPFLIAGCYLGDPTAFSFVVLEFPASEHLSATNHDVKEALKIIDEAFVANGFTRDKHPPGPEDRANGIIVEYGSHHVSIKGHGLIVTFPEFGETRPSAVVGETCSLMKEKLSRRFGVERVKVEVR